MKLPGPLLLIFETSLRTLWRFPGPFLVPSILRNVIDASVNKR